MAEAPDRKSPIAGPVSDAVDALNRAFDAGRNAALQAFPGWKGEREARLMNDIMDELERARGKRPGPNATALALMEEVGDLAAALMGDRAVLVRRVAVRREAIQVAAMAMRVVLDHDDMIQERRHDRDLDGDDTIQERRHDRDGDAASDHAGDAGAYALGGFAIPDVDGGPDPFAMMTKAAADVLTERGRQRAEEGFDEAHDDVHNRNGELADAAASFAKCGGSPAFPVFNPPPMWPRNWHRIHWKPGDRRRSLVKAGALILAEIERLDRRSANQGGE